MGRSVTIYPGMSAIITILSAALLIFNALGALYGGGSFMLYPDGSGLQMPLSYLEHTPFRNFFIPGLILFVANGLLSTVALATYWLHRPAYPLWVLAQGAILAGWILCQIALIRIVVELHYIMGGTGLALMLCGWWLWRHRQAGEVSRS